MKSDINNLLKQAQKMQAQMQTTQKELADMEVTGEAGGGMVKVVMTGRHDVKRVSIDPSVMTDDKEILEDLIAAAVNDAVRKIEKASKDKLSALTAGLQLPAGFGGAGDE